MAEIKENHIEVTVASQINSSKRALRALQKNKWNLVEIDGLPLHQSPLLSQMTDLVHGFTTRHGGDSKEPMESFNLGRHIDDPQAREDAIKNRQRLCQSLKLDFSRLAVPGQVHSNRIVSSTEKHISEVDAIATNERSLPILLHFADCVPIIIFAPDVPALAVVHAGWKGTAGSIAKNAVEFLCSEFGCSRQRLVAAVGPAIGSCCFPVTDETANTLLKTVSGDRTFLVENNQPHPDLKAINAMQLFDSGVDSVDVCDLCTACQPEIFYSHRYAGGKTGRQGAIASINYIS